MNVCDTGVPILYKKNFLFQEGKSIQWNDSEVENCLLRLYPESALLHFPFHRCHHYFDYQVDHLHGPLANTRNFYS